MPSLFDINNYKDRIESLVFTKTNNILKIDGDISISISSGLKLSVQDVSFTSPDGENLFKSEELLIAPLFFPLLKGELLFNSIKIVNPTIYITKRNNKKNNWETAFNINKEDKIKKDFNKDLENKKSQKKLNPLNINSLNVVDAIILSNIENKKSKFDNINFRLNYKNNNQYLIHGDIFYKKEKIKFSYDLKYLEKNININGYIKGKDLEVNNNTTVDMNTFNGQSTIYVKINKLDSFFENNYLRDQSLKLDAILKFTNKSIKIDNARVTNKKNLINLEGDLTKKGKKNIINFNVTTEILDADDLLLFNTKTKKLNEVQDENNKNKNLSKNKQNHLLDVIFKKLNLYEINVNFFAKEIIYKKNKIKKVKAKVSKKNNLDITVSLNSKFFKKLTIMSKIDKEKFSTFVMYVDNLDIQTVNDYMGYNKLSGLFNLSIEGNTNIKNKSKMLNQLNGKLKLKTKNMQINDLNLKELKSNITSIENINNLLELNKKFFKGNTAVKNQEIFIEIKNGNLKLPKTDIILDDDIITVIGFYELVSRNINASLKYNNEKNKLLSLFNVSLKGNIKEIETSLDYDKEKVDQLIGDMVEKKMKKIIKDKLDSKFNNIIENLLD
tara:strand:+ start:10914 stop:12749 length:1836 start_codon:yes stop_codon:yes gene_type:complete